MSETTPLMSETPPGASNYYFLHRRNSSNVSEHVHMIPEGATEDEFASRPVTMVGQTTTQSNTKPTNFFSRLFSSNKNNSPNSVTTTTNNNNPNPTPTSPVVNRTLNNKISIKIEPKVFFANERTFLAWLHTSVLLAGASIAITGLSKDTLLAQLYGVILLPISIAFIGYAMFQFSKRGQMIRRRAPGPYEDTLGPSVLAIVLMISIITQFSIKLYTILNYE